MNEENLDRLKKQHRYMEVGERLHGVLERAISKELPKFNLAINAIHVVPWSKIGNRDFVRYQLEYSRDANSNAYYLNANNVTLHKAGEPFPRSQRFDFQRFPQFTLTEAYNLLSGRSAEKMVPKRDAKGELVRDEEGKVVLVPVSYKLDTSIKDAYDSYPHNTYYPGYKFNLEETLARYRPENIITPRKDEDPLKALRRGDFIEATIPIGQKKVPVYLAADPEWRSMETRSKNGIIIPNVEIFPEIREKAAERRAAKEQGEDSGERQNAEWQQGQSWQRDSNEEERATARGR